jgi:predicted DNA-binding transcriptional regulator AlpA
MDTLHPGVTGRATETDDTRRLLPARKVQDRYGISDRTLDRWLVNEALKFPRPIYVNRRRYFCERELTMWERSRAREVARASQAGE